MLFIATANTLSTIPAPLLDRTEMIHIPGYTHEEKVHIASRHLIPKQYREHGLVSEQIHITEDALKLISKIQVVLMSKSCLQEFSAIIFHHLFSKWKHLTECNFVHPQKLAILFYSAVNIICSNGLLQKHQRA